MMEKKNYYDILEVAQNASPEELQRAYQRVRNAYSQESLALYSLMGQDETSEILNLIEEAYSILGLPEKRREYDLSRGFNKDQKTSQGQSLTSIDQRRSSVASAFDEIHRGSFDSRENVEISKIAASNKFTLRFEKNPEMEEEINNIQTFNGDTLKRIREYKGVDIPRLSDMTRVSKTYLKCIETDDYENLPAAAYTRGFVFQYAKCLKLNPDLVATSYMSHLQSIRDGKKH